MSKPISDLFTARVAFDERTDIAMSAADFRESKLPDLISKQYSPTWLAGRHACFHAALKAERARLAPINKAVAEVLKAAEGFESCAQYREDEYISKLFLALKNLRDVLSGDV